MDNTDMIDETNLPRFKKESAEVYMKVCVPIAFNKTIDRGAKGGSFIIGSEIIGFPQSKE